MSSHAMAILPCIVVHYCGCVKCTEALFAVDAGIQPRPYESVYAFGLAVNIEAMFENMPRPNTDRASIMIARSCKAYVAPMSNDLL